MTISSREEFTNLLKSLDKTVNISTLTNDESKVVNPMTSNRSLKESSLTSPTPVAAPSDILTIIKNSERSSETVNGEDKKIKDKSMRLDFNFESLSGFNKDLYFQLFENLGCRSLKRVLLPFSLAISLSLSPNKDNFPVIEELLKFIDRLIKENGLEVAVKVFKDLNTVTRRNVLNQKVKDDFCIGGMWWDTYKVSKIPRKLPLFNKLIKEDPRLAVNLSNGYTIFKLKPKIDLSTVETPFTGDKEVLDQMSKNLFTTALVVQKEMNLPILNPFRESNYRIHSSLKAGPNEPVSLLGAWKDSKAIKESNNEKFTFHCETFNRPDLFSMYNALSNYDYSKTELDEIRSLGDNQTLKCDDETKTGIDTSKLNEAKLVFIPDKGGKTRVIFVQNYLYQELLHPFHLSMMNWLRNHPCDATFRQREVALKVKYLTKSTDVWSFDLTAATDRWPIETQLATLKGLLSMNSDLSTDSLDKIMYSWLDLMKVKPFVHDINRFTYYEVGQPMGSYCSWPAMAITHHMVCEYIRLKLSIENRPWYILGDDIVIYNKMMASEYKDIILKLGMNISENKSYVPENQVVGHSAEFAKYIFCDGVEYTPFSPIAFEEIFSQHQWWKTIDLIKWLRDTVGTSIILSDNNTLEVSQILDSFLSLLFKKDREKVLLIISFKEINDELSPLEPLSPDKLVVYPNEWKQTSGAHLGLLMHKLELVGESVAQSFSSLMKLKSELGGGNLKTTRGYGLESAEHPLHIIVKDLDQCILDISRRIDQQSSHKDAIDLLTDVSLIRDVLIKGRKLSMWDRDNRSSGIKSRDHMIIELHKLMYPKSVPLKEEECWDW